MNEPRHCPGCTGWHLGPIAASVAADTLETHEPCPGLLPDNTEAVEVERDRLRAELAAIRGDLVHAESSLTNLRTKLANTREQLAAAQARIAALENSDRLHRHHTLVGPVTDCDCPSCQLHAVYGRQITALEQTLRDIGKIVPCFDAKGTAT